jgi:hypothetical protein
LRRTAVVVVGVMGVMTAGGLALALATVGVRREHDTNLPQRPKKAFIPATPPPVETPGTPTPPARLAALGWLPSDSSFVAGLDVAELRRTDAGRALLAAPLKLGALELRAENLEQWAGVRAEDVDHIAVGVKLDDAIPPCVVLVVRTRRRYDGDAVRTALHVEAAMKAGRKTLYPFKPRLGRVELRPQLCCADDRTLVVGLFGKDMASVPDEAADGDERLPAAVRELLEQRVATAAPLWAVAASDDGWKTIAPFVFGGFTKEDAEKLAKVHGVAAAYLPEQGALVAVLHAADAETAAALEEKALAAKPADADWKAAPEGAWLTLQLRGGWGEVLRSWKQ